MPQLTVEENLFLGEEITNGMFLDKAEIHRRAVDILKRNVGVDDALDVFAVHGVGGIWGALATGLFATTTVNAPLAEV